MRVLSRLRVLRIAIIPAALARAQNRLGANDLLNEYIRHIGSAIFAVPAAPKEGHYIGQSLFS